MGFSHGLGFWAFLLCFFLLSLLLSSLPSPSISQPIHQPYALRLAAAPPRQLFHIMKPKPDPSDGDLVKNSKRRRRRRRRKKKSPSSFTSRPFSAMLPRGFNVPPSGSSSCHNDVPNNIDFFCGDVSTSDP
ncbi:hypothetical protein COCNU_scaffold178732G000010 [Cocos nucifera]|nr:hypothetical protein [Cocos nucifera]